MTSSGRLPEEIREDVSIYLSPAEKILKALTPFEAIEDVEDKRGRLWVLLTNFSVIFHTCEKNKEPLIALMARKDIKEIEYYEREKDIQITFVPKKNTLNVTKLTFSQTKQTELEDFCEDLAELITYKKEKDGIVQVFCESVAKNTDEVLSKSEIIKKEVSLAEKIAFLTTQDNLLKEEILETKKRIQSPLPLVSSLEPFTKLSDSNLKHTVSSINLDSNSSYTKPLVAPVKNERITVKTVEATAVVQPERQYDPQPEPKREAEKQLEEEFDRLALPPLRKKLNNSYEKVEIPETLFDSPETEAVETQFEDITLEENETRPLHIFATTAVSLLIAYIWYKFFKFIEKNT